MNVKDTFCICKTKTCDLCFVHAGFHCFQLKMAFNGAETNCGIAHILEGGKGFMRDA